MSQNTKGFFRTLPIALLLQAIVLAIGFTIYGENFNTPAINIVGVFLGSLAYFQVKKYLRSKQAN